MLFISHFSSHILCFVLLGLVLLSHSCKADECKWGRYDFSPLEPPGNSVPWLVKTVNNSVITTYQLSICNPVTFKSGPCQSETSACRSVGDTSEKIGTFTNDLNITEDHEKGEFQLHMHGDDCTHTPGQKLKTIIIFKCGKTLGSPDFLESYGCETYFEWHTSVACLEKPPVEKEVRCYVYDTNGKKRDLNPLIKDRGGHLIDSSGDRDIYINICRDIIPDGPTSTCSKGSSGCIIQHGTATTIGKPKGPLTITADGKLRLEYNIPDKEDKPEQCSQTPSTAVTLECPKEGGGKTPLLISDQDCHYEIVWVTEYACPVEEMTSNTCQLTSQERGFNIDLRPLTNPTGTDHPTRVEVKENDKTYTYYLNICGELGIECPDDEHKKDIAACQMDLSNPSWGHSLGSVKHQQLRYSDGEISLTYKGGDKCSNHFQRTTIIRFHCNETAGNAGKGSPVFDSENNCTYIFDWGTKNACLKHTLATTCSVQHGKKRFDLSSLVKTESNNYVGANWEALDGHHEHIDSDEGQYFINVCHDILRQGDAQNCPEGSAVCLKAHDGTTKNLGQYLDSPTYDNVTNTIKLVYKEGETCDTGKKIETSITLVCRPGDLEGAPVLIRKSLDECMYEFEWHTAAACMSGTWTGKDCKVNNPEMGVSFDLSRLTKVGDQAYYNVTRGTESSAHLYLINVCGEVKGTACNTAGKISPAGCQVEKAGQNPPHSIGKSSSIITYHDGLLNLTYIDGDNYKSTPPIPRRTEIAFLCDEKAGKGEPEFLHEGEHTYSFKWQTALACPGAPVECIVTDEITHKQYDLSSLSMSEDQENWSVVDDADKSKKRKFYLNVCRPVNPVHIGKGCDVTAASCLTTAEGSSDFTITNSNLGQATSRPSIVNDGNLMLKYDHGADCTLINGTVVQTSMTIHFVCKKGSLSTGPRYIQQFDNCEFSFMWETEAACPIEDTETKVEEPCTVKDKNSEYTINLQPLMKKGSDVYSVPSEGGKRVFKLNVCGPINIDGCGKIGEKATSVCEKKQDGYHPVTQVSDKLEFSDDGQLTLTYEGNVDAISGKKKQVRITFLCRRDIPLGEPTFIREESNLLVFNFETALACHPEPIDCLVSDDKGQQYDLTPLGRIDTNWLVVDTRQDHKDLKYYINVCRPINPIDNATCPGGPIGGCQTSNGGQSYNMGYIQGKPAAASDGSLSIRYMGGSVCHSKDPAHKGHRSTRINFYCSENEQDPSFEEETPGCEYVFNWRTPTACPLKRVIGQDCKVTDPLYNYEFNLGHLKKMAGNYESKTDDYKFLLNVCGPINDGTGSCAGVGSCQTKQSDDNFMVDAGKPNQALIYEDGEVTLKYDNGKGCHSNKFNRTTILTFTCDNSKFGAANGPTFLEERDDCTYMFEWPTALVCPPFKLGECSTRDDKGNEYDLSLLILTNDNYEVDEIQTTPRMKFVLNVCTSVIHKKGITCPHNAAACMVNLDEKDPKKKYHNIGELNSHPLKLDNGGNLLLTYTNGEDCTTGDSTKKTETVIHLHCDIEQISSQPQYSYKENCQYHFTWFSKVACPLKSTDTSTKPKGDCTAKNPETGYTFDLNRLHTTDGYEVSHKDEHKIKFNVCGPIDNSACGENTGACQEETKAGGKHWKAGEANSDLRYNEGVLTLSYKNGEICHHNNQSRTTIINFVCGSEGSGTGRPQFVDETDDCTYFISWHTELACEKRVRCVVENGTSTIDLSPLIKSTGYHTALQSLTSGTNDNAAYYINICRPLNPIEGTLCPPQASACKVTQGELPKSLGHVHNAPYIDKSTGRVTLVYDHGTKCEKHPEVNATSKIVFVCDPGPQLGDPVLELISENCEYRFQWKTNVVCTETKPTEVTNDCKFYDSRTKHTYDLSSLKSSAGYQYPDNDNKFYINVCAAVTQSKSKECKTAGVCHSNKLDQETSFGESSAATFDLSDEILTLTYKNGAPCTSSGDGKASSQIKFECNHNAENGGKGKPEVFLRSACHVVFRWKTALVCPTATAECVFSHNGHTFDLSLLSRATSSWELTDVNNNKYWLNICEGVHKGPGSSDCSTDSAICRKLADGKTVDSLGKVTTQKISMDDDGKTILLSYSGGTNACSHKKRRSDNMPAKTTIKFTCANSVGGPLFEPSSGGEACQFVFTWKTSLACQVERETLEENREGVIQDKRTGGVIDLGQLVTSTNHFFADEHRGNGDHFRYIFNINGSPKLDSSYPDSARCKNAVICQTKIDDKTFYRSLGDYVTRKFYMEAGILEGVYTSEATCGTEDSRVKTIIQFHCSQNADVLHSQPSFNYMSVRECEYMFDWYTPMACVVPDVKNPKPISGGGTGGLPQGGAVNNPASGSPKTSTIVAIVAVFGSVVFLCLLALIFHKKDRRVACARFIFRRSAVPSYRYSNLTSLEDDENSLLAASTSYGTLHEDELQDTGADEIIDDITEQRNSKRYEELKDSPEVAKKSEPFRKVRGVKNKGNVNIKTYHDDSDDDMLL